MNLASFPQLKKLPADKKLELANELWNAGVSESMPVAPEHKRILDERWAAYKSGKIKRISMAELNRRLKQK